MTKDLCVLVHGFTGSPQEVEPLAERLKSHGYDTVVPVLHGHCGSKEELKAAKASHWIHSVKPLVEEGLKQGRVHLVGFSMGAMISAIVASELPVASLTMLAPAVYYASPKHLFQQTATLIKAAWQRGGMNQDYVKRRMEKMTQTPLESVRQFRRLVQMGIHVLPKLELPVCIIQGEKDEVVEARGAQFVFSTIGSVDKELHSMPLSGHMLCLDGEAELVNELVLRFLERV